MNDEMGMENTQWTPAAREAYLSQGEELLVALKAHLELTSARAGRQAEHVGYFASADRLNRAAYAFNNAEFDWCGSSGAFRLDDWDDEDEVEDEDDVEDEEGQVLTVVGRWDYIMVDREAVIAAGREAYGHNRSEDTAEDARIAIVEPGNAVAEIAHAGSWDDLDHTPGLESKQSSVVTIVHDGDDWDGLDDDVDPFTILDDRD